MSYGERERKCNIEKHKKKQKQKRKKAEQKIAQAISRNKRNEVRNSVKPHNTFRNIETKSLLFIIGDTANMECILLQKKDIGKNRTLLTLPVINQEMVNDYLNANISRETNETSMSTMGDQVLLKNVINYYYSISAESIIDVPEGNLLVIKGIKFDGLIRDLISVNVRPYNLNTWYDNEFSTVDALRIYSGKKLKTFFYMEDEYSNIYVLQDTILKIALYKGLMRKIDITELSVDIQTLAKKGGSGLYPLMATDIDVLYERFKNEFKENTELNMQRKRKYNSNE